MIVRIMIASGGLKDFEVVVTANVVGIGSLE
jgi:hypothetical protein